MTHSAPGAPAPQSSLWRHPAFLGGSAAALALIVIALLWVDAPTAHFFAQYRDSLLRGAFKQIERLGESHWYLVPSGLIALSLLYRRSRLGWQAWFMFAAVAGTGLACVVLKALLGRPRPGRFLSEDAWGFQFLQTSASYWSFPSGHTTTAFAVAACLALLLPRARWLWFTIALVAGFGRVVTGSHFPGDVVAGAWLGTVGTLWIWPWFRARTPEARTHG